MMRTRAEYLRRFRDAAYWQPYIDVVLRRHGLSRRRAAIGSGGTFPTFLVDDLVVKFFPKRFDGSECFVVERALHTTVLDQAELAVPRHVADGRLFDSGGWRWPYLVTTRLAGTPWRSALLTREQQHAVASQLGEMIRRVHDLEPPSEPVFQRDAVAELRASCSARQRRFSTVPAELVAHIDDYLAPRSAERRLLHADLHRDHVFVDGARLVGVIDWGDALYADPYYELPSLYLGTFRGDKSLLRAFLDGYRWPLCTDFAHRAMTMTLIHEFNPLSMCSPNFEQFATLEELASHLWQL